MGSIKTYAASPIFIAIALVVIIILCGLYLASRVDPEIINRFGATLSALGAVLVLYQTAIEVRNEEKSAGESITVGMMSPADSEVARKVVYERGRLRKAERIKIIAAIAIIVFFGELMHGWGDRIYRAVFGTPKATHVEARIAEGGGLPMPVTPAEFGQFTLDGIEKWRKVVEFARVSADQVVQASPPMWEP